MCNASAGAPTAPSSRAWRISVARMMRKAARLHPTIGGGAAAGSVGCPPVGAGKHPGLGWRPRRGHGVWPVGRCGRAGLPAGHARLARLVSAHDPSEPSVACQTLAEAAAARKAIATLMGVAPQRTILAGVPLPVLSHAVYRLAADPALRSQQGLGQRQAGWVPRMGRNCRLCSATTRRLKGWSSQALDRPHTCRKPCVSAGRALRAAEAQVGRSTRCMNAVFNTSMVRRAAKYIANLPGFLSGKALFEPYPCGEQSSTMPLQHSRPGGSAGWLIIAALRGMTGALRHGRALRRWMRIACDRMAGCCCRWRRE